MTTPAVVSIAQNYPFRIRVKGQGHRLAAIKALVRDKARVGVMGFVMRLGLW